MLLHPCHSPIDAYLVLMIDQKTRVEKKLQSSSQRFQPKLNTKKGQRRKKAKKKGYGSAGSPEVPVTEKDQFPHGERIYVPFLIKLPLRDKSEENFVALICNLNAQKEKKI